MTNKKPLVHPHSELKIYSEETSELRQYLQASTSDNTRKAYRSAIRQFEKWGGRLPCDRDTLVRYLLAKAKALNVRTLDLHVTAISHWHQVQLMNDPAYDPLVRKTLVGIRRIHGRPKQKAKALRLEHVAAMLNHLRELPETRKSKRDIALILSGFFGAFRRSELVAIQVSDLIWEQEGLLIRLPRSKTDQIGIGLVKALPYGNDPSCCAATAIKDWLDSAEIQSGPIFRPVNRWDKVQNKAIGPGAINELLKVVGGGCGFDFVPELSSHSLRRGLSTTAAREELAFDLIKKQGGWKNDATVREYIEEGRLFSNNVANQLMGALSEILEK